MSRVITVIGNGRRVVVTDFGKPSPLDGASMQFVVTNEATPLGECLAYFCDEADAVGFARWKADQNREPR